MKKNSAYVVQASFADITELDQAYAIARPKDPDRVLYELIHKSYPEGVFVCRRGRKLVSAVYCIGFSSGSGCIGGFFLDETDGYTESMLMVIRRCLLHLKDKGCTEVFASVREQNLEDLKALSVAGFTILSRRRVGIIRNTSEITQGNESGILYDQSEARKAIGQFIASGDATSEKGTIASWFWPHRFSDAFLNDLLNSESVFAISSGKDKDNLVLARISSGVSTGKRWFVFPQNLAVHIPKRQKKVGEIILIAGTNISKAISAAIDQLVFCGAERVYLYLHEPPDQLDLYERLGFQFQQPQIILSRCIKRSNSTPHNSLGSMVSSTLDKYFNCENT